MFGGSDHGKVWVLMVSGKDAKLAVQASTSACSAGPWNSCET